MKQTPNRVCHLKIPLWVGISAQDESIALRAASRRDFFLPIRVRNTDHLVRVCKECAKK